MCGILFGAIRIAPLCLSLNGFLLYVLNFGVNKDASAELANDDLLVHTDVELALCRYLAVATAARVALDGNNGESVT